MSFRHSLRFRITLLFIFLMAAGNTLSLLTANRIVADRYSTFSAQSDLQKARFAARVIENSWEEWSSKLHEGDPRFIPDGEKLLEPEEKDRPRMGMMRTYMNSPDSDHIGPNNSDVSHLVITDGKGNILLSTIPGSLEKITGHYEEGIPVRADGETVAYVMSGSMINREMSRADQQMLRTITVILIITYLFSSLIIMVLGILSLGRILSSLKKIDRAVGDLAGGRLSARSHVTGLDELGLLGERFDSMALALEESEEWKRRIIADTAHELRTPAALMQSRLEMLRDGIYEADEKQLASLHGEAQNFSRLIGDMQKLSSLESGTSTNLECEKGDLISFTLNQLNAFRPGADEKEIRFTWKGSEPPVTPEESFFMKLDWARMDQIFKNLLSNALRHTPRKGQVDLDIRIKSNSITIKVSDSGPGIPREERTRIFDRFYRLDSSRSRQNGGYGLGLAISKAITETHGGRIYVEEAYLGGAAFCVELPRTPE